jgi:DNA (cytosine-5)-methyltransferase 1
MTTAHSFRPETAKVRRTPAPIEVYSVLSNGASVRGVRRRSGVMQTTAMGRVDGRRGETRAERADRAFLTSSSRPEPGAGPALRVVDLFSGCGGLSLGAEEACRAVGRAFEAVGAFDRNADALETYAANFSGVKTWDRNIARLFDGKLGTALTRSERELKKQLGRIDLLLAGPPCQGWSSLNNETRGDDPKNRLYRRVARATEVLEPTYVLIENVVAARRGPSPSGTINHLEKLRYAVRDGVVPLLDIGVAQRRRRHVVVAVPDDEDPVEIDEVLAAFAQRPRSLRWAIGDLADAEPKRDFDKQSRISKDNEPRIAWLRTHKDCNLPNRLRPPCQQGDDHTYGSMYGRLDWEEAAQTITSGYGSMGQGRYVHPDAKRTLTPHEAARVQFFPDWFGFGDHQRGAWATLIGNAVPLKLSYAIAVWLLR